MKKISLLFSIWIVLSMAVTAQAEVITLPDPNIYLGSPGEYLASRHNDFYAYSNALNDLVHDAYGFDWPDKINNNDMKEAIILYTGGNTKNLNLTSLNLTFPDALLAPAGTQNQTFPTPPSTLTTWGGTTVTVDKLVSYLHTFDENNNTPVFFLDLNEPGTTNEDDPTHIIRDLDIHGYVTVFSDSGIAAQWYLDNGTINDWVTAQGQLVIPGVTLGLNTGASTVDFLAYAPDMDLSEYLNPTGNGTQYYFKTDFWMRNLDNGYDQIGIIGNVVPGRNAVPEPTSISLLGIGLLSLAALRRKK